jgi:hypothetical protein
VVLYDFAAEEEDEVAIVKGESLDVAYEVGGWLQVGTSSRAVASCQSREEEEGSCKSLLNVWVVFVRDRTVRLW